MYMLFTPTDTTHRKRVVQLFKHTGCNRIQHRTHGHDYKNPYVAVRWRLGTESCFTCSKRKPLLASDWSPYFQIIQICLNNSRGHYARSDGRAVFFMVMGRQFTSDPRLLRCFAETKKCRKFACAVSTAVVRYFDTQSQQDDMPPFGSRRHKKSYSWSCFPECHAR